MVRSFRSIAAAIAALAIPLAAAPTAPADVPTYTQYACHTPDGAPAPVDGFSSTVNGGGSATNDCGAGGGITLDIPTTPTSGTHVSAGWLYDQPSGTNIQRITYHRTITNIGAPDTSTTREWQAPSDECGPSVPCSPDSTIEGSLGQSLYALFLVQCQTSDPCHGSSAGDGQVVIDRVAVSLQDPNPPQMPRQPSGDLFGGGTVSGTRTVDVTATDQGGGVYQEAFVIDGVEQGRVSLDRNGGTCVEPFVTRIPCPGSVEGTLQLDTSTLADGTHAIGVIVYDATGVNSVSSTPVEVSVNNDLSGTSASQTDPSPSSDTASGQSNSAGATGSSVPDGTARLSLLGRASRGKIVAPFGREAFIRGAMTGIGGRPTAGVTLQLFAADTHSEIARVVTDVDGRFQFAVRATASTNFVVRGVGVASTPVRLVVRPSLRLSASRRRLRNGQTLSLQAKTAVRGRARVAFQVLIGHYWRTFAVKPLSGRGSASVLHRFTVTYSRLVYRFRALLVPGPRFPYTGARSNTTSVLVN